MVSRKENEGAVLVTGATGFVGAHLVRALKAADVDVRTLARPDFERIAAGEVGTTALEGADAVVHLAARAHVLDETSSALLDVYRKTNRDGTLVLARAAAAVGARRFVFVSSIRVNGACSPRPFRSDDPPHPDEPYAISKFEAEQGLWRIAEATGLEVVIVRPPLVYGPGVKANFRRLLGLAATGIPLPLASIEGLRSLIGVRNLADLLRICLFHDNARGRTFLASDGTDISLPALIRELAVGMGRRPRLLPMPPGLVRALAALGGKADTFDKLAASLQVDATETFNTLDWRPPISLAAGLRETARWYAESRHR